MKRLLLAVITVLGVANLAFATSTTDQLQLHSGATTITVTDNEVSPQLDGNPADGTITWSGTIDGWTIAVAGGETFSPSAVPIGLDIFSLTASCSGGGCSTDNLTISYSDINFTTPVPAGGFSTFFSATIANGTASQTAWDDTSNTIFGHGTPIGTVGPFSAPGNHGTATGGGPAGPGAYSLTITDTINAGSSVTAVSLDGNITAVPEPSSLVLFGTGLLAFASFAKRKFRRS